MASSSRKFVGPKSGLHPAWLAAAACLLLPVAARAEDPQPASPETGGLPSSSGSIGASVSPEAPPTPPAPGGRAPSFGTSTDPDAWVFRIGGRVSGFAQVGLGRKPAGSSAARGTALHTPPLIVGKSPFWAGPGGSLNFQYGTQTVMAFVSVEAALAGQEWQGYYANEHGPRIRTAYLAVNPEPMGDLRLRFQVGAFPSNYGAPGPWGWGIYGPVLAVHGYGGTASATYDLSPSKRLSFEYGVAAVPEVDEGVARGTYTDWPEAGLSTIVHHAHAGLSIENKYFAKLHLARAAGSNLRRYLDDDDTTVQVEQGSDGRMDVAALELRWVGDPYGQLGVTPVYWNFKDALSVHDGIWWGLDWTAGGREMTNKFLGAASGGNGQIAAVTAQYDFSVKRMLMHPQPFDGNGPDLRVSLAFLPFFTLQSEDPSYDRKGGYFVGASVEHVMLSWLSAAYHVYGESRDGATVDVAARVKRGKWTSYSGTLGLILHSSWQSQDRIALAYTRYFYSHFTDNNPALPLDRDVFTLGGSVAF